MSFFGIGLKGSIFEIIVLFVRRRILRVLLIFFDLYLSRQAGKFVKFSLSVLKFGVVLGGGGGGDDVILGDSGGYLCRVTGKFVSFSLSVLKFGVVGGRGGGSNNEKEAGGGGDGGSSNEKDVGGG